MTPEKLAQLKTIVEHFRGQEPTDEQIIAFCTEKSIDAIDSGTLSDFLFQYEADELTARLLPKIAELLAKWTPPSSFAPSNDQTVAVNILARDILALLEAENTSFLLATSVLDSLATNLASVVRGSSQRATDVKMAVANTYLIRQFGKEPNRIGVGDIEIERKSILEANKLDTEK